MADKDVPSVVQDSFENNKWMKAKGWEIPINIEPPIELLQSLLESLNSLLDFTLFVLDFIKAFVRNFLNPLLSIVKKIIAFLKSILQDLRQVGIYFTSDLPLFADKEKLLGGYPAFERRMLARLTNDADPNRPNFSPQSAVFGLYLYGDSNFGDISAILRLLQQMGTLFGKNLKPPPPPTITNVSTTNVRIRNSLFDEVGEEALELKWQVAGNNGGLFNNEIGGFLIEVSTELDGFYLAYDSIVENATFATDKGGKRQRGLVSDERFKSNVRIFGGSVWLKTLKSLFYEEGSQKPFELKLVKNPNSNVTVSPNELVEGKTQRTYFVPVFDFSMDNSKEYSVRIKYADLPEAYDIETKTDIPREKVAIRIRTLDVESRELVIKNTSGITRDFVGEPKYYYDPLHVGLSIDRTDNVTDGVKAKVHYGGFTKELRYSPPSDPTIVNVASIQEEFRQICFWAVATSILRGYDLTKANPAIAEIMPTVNVNVMGSSNSKGYKNGNDFGLRLHRDINSALNKAFEKVKCSDTLQGAIIEAYEGLTDTGMVTGVEDFFGEDGLFVFPTGMFQKKNRKIDRLYGNVGKLVKNIKGRESRQEQEGLIEELLGKVNGTVALETPCYYDTISDGRAGIMEFGFGSTLFRGLMCWAASDVALIDDMGVEFSVKVKPTVDEESLILTILNLLFGSQQLTQASDWSCFRLFPEGIPALDKILNKSIAFMENVQDTLEGFGKKILKAIAAIEEKINRIQQMIAFIDQLLELLKGLVFETQIPLYALAHVAEGTDGLVAKLLSSQLKPSYSQPTVDPEGNTLFGWNPHETHAAGMFLVAGGLGTVELFEFLIKLLVSEEEETPDTIIIAEEEE